MTDLPLSSRYRFVAERRAVLPSGEEVRFLGRRIIPDPERMTPLARHRVVVGDRVDQVAAGGYGDPLLYWRIVDSAGEDDPAAVTRSVGRLLVVPLPYDGGGNG